MKAGEDNVASFAPINGIQLHYLEYPGPGPALVLLPGLTANAHLFDGLIVAGLAAHYHVIAPDLRGRGLSDKPLTGYSMADHAADIIGLLDHLHLEQCVLCGHSYGGLVAFYMAAQFPERIHHLIILDSSHLLVAERTRVLVKASLDRLNQKLPSMDVYMAAMEKMPYLNGLWDEAIAGYYRSDVQINADGTVQALASATAVAEAIDMEFVEPWLEHLVAIHQPTLLINALEPFGPPGTPPILPRDMAEATVALIAQCDYVVVPGNHITMLFGENAAAIVDAISHVYSDWVRFKKEEK